MALFSGLSRLSRVPAGRAAKAASVGAKTVKGPGPFMVSTRPAAPSCGTAAGGGEDKGQLGPGAAEE